MLRPSRATLLLSCIAMVSTGPARLEAQATPTVSRDTTTVRSYDGRTMPAEVIRLGVRQRRSDPEPTVTLAALRIASTAPRPVPPIVFLMGGPGIPGSVMAPVPPDFTLFQRLRELADVVIVDQREIGLSTPRLDCPVDDQPPADLFLHRATILRACATGSPPAACPSTTTS